MRIIEAGERQRSQWEVASPAIHGGATLFSYTTAIDVIDPLAVFQRNTGEERALWMHPNTAFSMVAIGAAASLSASGPERFAEIEVARRRLLSTAIVEQAAGCPVPAPVFMGGFSFDPAGERAPEWSGFPDALLIVPRLLFTRQGESCWLTVNSMSGPDDDAMSRLRDLATEAYSLYRGDGPPAHQDGRGAIALAEEPDDGTWMEAVAEVVEHVRRGVVDKLVLARRVQVSLPQPVDTTEALRRLAQGYSHCTIFAFAHDDACFLGATPERLVRVDHTASDERNAPRTVRVDCLAGSARRGETEEEDRRLGEALLDDPKERYEHAVVARALSDDLRPLCSQLDIPEAPGLLLMPNVQHLHTQVEGTLNTRQGVLELAARLHPTPAAGGLPREAALPLIRTWEPFDRGWYAGPVGWIDGEGEGEFAVAIRSALIRGHEAFLYAGCGIVAGSDPEQEYAESCLKLRPMLWALSGSTI